jgi:hypothetical protein
MDLHLPKAPTQKIDKMGKLGKKHASIQGLIPMPGVGSASWWQGVIAVISVPKTIQVHL